MSEPRTAIVTGSADGIGKAIALRLAADGCSVVLNDLPNQSELLSSVVQEIESKGSRATFVVGDVSVEDDVRRLVEHAVSIFGGLDIMVANAAICVVKSLIDTTCEDLDRTMSINLKGVFLSYKYAAIQMIKQGKGGRIIGACSLSGKVGMQDLASYCASKFAVRGLTQSAAQEWGIHGITVNAYCPGPTWTPMMARSSGALDEKSIREVQENWAGRTAVRRIGQPQDIAGLVSFLASKESSFITGQNILMDGGMHFD